MGKGKNRNNRALLFSVVVWIALALIIYGISVSYAVYGFLGFITLGVSWFYHARTKSILLLLNMIISILVILYGLFVFFGSI